MSEFILNDATLSNQPYGSTLTFEDGVPVSPPATVGDVVRVQDGVHLDCPLLSKVRALLVNEGQPVTVEWELRDRNGTAIAASFDKPIQTVSFRFNEATGADGRIFQAVGAETDLSIGLVSCALPDDLVANSGLFTFNVALVDTDNAIRYIDHGLLSVERTLYGDIAQLTGPPTIGEIRLAMRDTLLENNLLDDVEFDDAELLQAIVRPVQYWNSVPPPVAIYTTRTFPHRHHWLLAISANLLKTAAVWYERNRLPATHGGLNVDDKNKLNPYLILAKQFEDEWRQFVTEKKVQINVGMCYGTVGDSYWG